MIPALLCLHIVAATVWIGGLVFMLLVLRPALAPLPGPIALGVMRRALARFLKIVWICVASLVLSGYAGVFLIFGGFGSAGLNIRIMHATGMLMMLLFVALWVGPWRQFRRHFDSGTLEPAAKALRQIRWIAMINLILGLFTACVAVSGGVWMR